MFSQTSGNFDTVSGASVTKIPIGVGLNGGTPSLPANDGSIALNYGTGELYYVGGNAWKLAGGPLVTLAAVGAVPNANGATLTTQVLNLQPASASFPGVVTTGAQSFNGTKTFSAIVAPGTNYITANPTAGTASNDGLTIDNTTNQVALELADTTHNGIVSTAAQSYAGIKTFDDGIVVTPTVTAGTDNLFNYQFHANIATTFTGAGTDITNSIIIQRTDAMGFVSWGASNQVLGGSGGVLTLSSTALPVEFRPSGTRTGFCSVVNNGTAMIGYYKISSAGVITIGKNQSPGTSALVAFDVGDTQILDCSSVYSFA